MMRNYSHIRTQAKRDAMAQLERPLSASEGAQKWAQFLDGAKPQLPN
jgi:hypothetical protein